MSVIVKARGLTKTYGKSVALDNVDFDVEAGRIVGLIGPNGAGKTTALKAVLGLTSFGGSLEVLGLDPMKQRHRLMKDVCFIADVAVLPRWIRVNQTLDFVEGVHPKFSREKAAHFLSRTKIKPRSRVKELSKGMIAQLHLALVMAIDARLLVLDEPTLGLDIIYRKEFYSNLLNDYFDGERTIIITTHQVEEVEHILTDLMFINDGKIVLNTSMDEVQERFTEVMVGPDLVEEARAMNPIYEREVFGKIVFLFDGADPRQLAELGERHNPSVADLFVATMKGAEA
ncbi:MAG: ABC transporter ATP-binding protein [Xanthomonadales bacterium]|nr:ABC transporter ATP-binding protein [Xanthomonadales bacterium]